MKIKIKNAEIQKTLSGKEIEYPKYATQIMNWNYETSGWAPEYTFISGRLGIRTNNPKDCTGNIIIRNPLGTSKISKILHFQGMGFRRSK